MNEPVVLPSGKIVDMSTISKIFDNYNREAPSKWSYRSFFKTEIIIRNDKTMRRSQIEDRRVQEKETYGKDC